MAYIEITGWDTDGEPVTSYEDMRDGENIDATIARAIERDDIVEIGDVRTYYDIHVDGQHVDTDRS